MLTVLLPESNAIQMDQNANTSDNALDVAVIQLLLMSAKIPHVQLARNVSQKRLNASPPPVSLSLDVSLMTLQAIQNPRSEIN